MIRAATPDDVPALIALGARMHAEGAFRVLRYSPERVSATLLALIGQPAGFVWVAEDAAGVYGGLAAACAQHWCSDDLVSMDLALFVEPDRRGGIAAARLVQRYRQWARERGAVMRRMGVTTGVHTERTAQLLEGLGMRRCGVILED